MTTGTTTPPKLRVLSLGAGVQSTAVLLLAAEGRIPPIDAAIFADTGWEPAAVYAHLDRLDREVAQPAGIPIHRVSAGNIRSDALDPAKRFASMPLFIKSWCERCNRTGTYTPPRRGWWQPPSTPCTACAGLGFTDGLARRQCTKEYKVEPIKAKVRELLGFPRGGPRPPRGVYAEQLIGISTDEAHRANVSDVGYAVNAWPLLDIGWSRRACLSYLDLRGWGSTAKSACVGCPFHGNAAWRRLRDESPAEFADAVEFDAAIRGGSARANATGSQLRGEAYLHRSMVPLDQAPIGRIQPKDARAGVVTIEDLLIEAELEEAELPGCSPFACRTDAVVLGADPT